MASRKDKHFLKRLERVVPDLTSEVLELVTGSEGVGEFVRDTTQVVATEFLNDGVEEIIRSHKHEHKRKKRERIYDVKDIDETLLRYKTIKSVPRINKKFNIELLAGSGIYYDYMSEQIYADLTYVGVKHPIYANIGKTITGIEHSGDNAKFIIKTEQCSIQYDANSGKKILLELYLN